MRRNVTIFLLFVCSLVCARVASAQDTRSFGVTMGIPGLDWRPLAYE